MALRTTCNKSIYRYKFFYLFAVDAADRSHGHRQESRMGKSHACCTDSIGQEKQGTGVCERPVGAQESGGKNTFYLCHFPFHKPLQL